MLALKKINFVHHKELSKMDTSVFIMEKVFYIVQNIKKKPYRVLMGALPEFVTWLLSGYYVVLPKEERGDSNMTIPHSSLSA